MENINAKKIECHLQKSVLIKLYSGFNEACTTRCLSNLRSAKPRGRRALRGHRGHRGLRSLRGLRGLRGLRAPLLEAPPRGGGVLCLVAHSIDLAV